MRIPGMCARSESGFTLIELLVVVAIMVAVASTASMVLNNVDQDSQARMARVEIANVARAIRQFKQDTGYYPGEGPFALSTGSCGSSTGAVVADPGLGDSWYETPANLGQLFSRPALCSTHPLAALNEWNPETGRGWRGPYLERSGEGFVDIGDSLPRDGDGSLFGGNELKNVPAVADPFVYHKPVHKGGSSSCTDSELDKTDCYLEWRSTTVNYDSQKHYLGGHGRPFLFFAEPAGFSRIVSMGPDGEYAGCDKTGGGGCDAADDLCTPKGDDIVICL